jgi:hypothetical protein
MTESSAVLKFSKTLLQGGEKLKSFTARHCYNGGMNAAALLAHPEAIK